MVLCKFINFHITLVFKIVKCSVTIYKLNFDYFSFLQFSYNSHSSAIIVLKFSHFPDRKVFVKTSIAVIAICYYLYGLFCPLS